MKKYLPILLLTSAILTGCGNEAASIGIIGGADGPTAIFVKSGFNWQSIALAVIAVAITALVIAYLKKKK